jgi:hypothetical protein
MASLCELRSGRLNVHKSKLTRDKFGVLACVPRARLALPLPQPPR